MRSLSISAAWDETKAVLARDGRLLLPVALAMVALPSVLSTLIDPNQQNNSGAIMLVLFLLSLVGMVGQLALIRLAVGPSVSVGEAIGHALRRALPFIGAVLLVVLGLAVLMIPLIILLAVILAAGSLGDASALDPAQLAGSPAFGLFALIALIIGLLVGVRLMMVSPVASVEGAGPVGILKRAWELTRGRFWKLLGFLLLFVIAAGILLFAVGGVTALIARTLFGELEPFTGAALFVAIVSGVLSALLTTVFSVMVARIYLQLAGHGEPEVSVPSSAD